MRVCILGLLEVWEDGSELRLRRGRQRALLVLLAVHANEVVSTDRLIDALWPEAPPPTAAKVVQTWVSQLRTVLPEGVLLTRPTGYLLCVDETDVCEFERLLGEAGEQQPAAAARTLRRALTLWRGPPLADTEYEPWAQAEIRRLEDLRLAAVEDRIDAELRLGRHALLVSELATLVAEHPLRERLRGQLMVALYRSGRQAEALEVYADARRRFVDELGIEPASELQELQRRVFAHDPTLGRGPRPPEFPGRRRPVVLMLAGAVLVIAAAVLATVELTAASGGIASLAPGSVGVIDSGSTRIVAQIPIAGLPARLAVGAGSVWVGSDQAGTVAELDARTRSVTSTLVSISGFPSAVTVGDGALWVLDGASGLLSKINPPYSSVGDRVRVSSEDAAYDRSRDSLDPYAVAVGFGSVWVTDGTGSLIQVDPATMRVIARHTLGVALDGVAVGGGSVWAISGPSALALALDAHGRVTARIPVASTPDSQSPFPLAVAWGSGFLWVLNGNTGTVTKIDARERAVVATIEIGVDRAPLRLAVGDGAAWVADADGTLTRIDASTNALTRFLVAHRLEDVAVAGRAIWVTAGAGLAGQMGSSANLAVGHIRALPTASCSPIYYQSGSKPQYLIVADVSLRGPGYIETAQTAEAIQLVLEQHHFQAGRYTLGLQVCDDSTVQAEAPSATRCAANAQAYAEDASVIGVIGAWSSSCSQVEVPIADRAPAGPLAMVAPANTYVGLTHRGPGTAPNEPGKYYPRGTRNYVRLVASDDVQGAADALLARRLGAKSIYVVNGGLSYGDGLTAAVKTAAAKLGLKLAGSSGWNFQAPNNQALVATLQRAHPDAVFLASFLFPPSARLIADLRAGLPARTRLLLPDGFAPAAALIANLGSAADGITISVAGLPTGRLPIAGRRFVAAFAKSIGKAPLNPYTVDAAEAADVLLDAIARSNGTRASVTRQLFTTHVRNGILGSFSFDRNGDTTSGAVTIYKIENGTTTIYGVITPEHNLIHRRMGVSAATRD
jgi:DNA-binding SARP family transcriptional activator/ABC-type branched-subunit amino acid transport system substrate-binding protein/streptogramin lyase